MKRTVPSRKPGFPWPISPLIEVADRGAQLLDRVIRRTTQRLGVSGFFNVGGTVGAFDAVGVRFLVWGLSVARIMVGGRFLVQGDADVDEVFDGVVMACYGAGFIVSV